MRNQNKSSVHVALRQNYALSANRGRMTTRPPVHDGTAGACDLVVYCGFTVAIKVRRGEVSVAILAKKGVYPHARLQGRVLLKIDGHLKYFDIVGATRTARTDLGLTQR